jgi:hypothetical protein
MQFIYRDQLFSPTILAFIPSYCLSPQNGFITQADLSQMDINDLLDLLVVKTNEYLLLVKETNSDGSKLSDVKFEIAKIEAALSAKFILTKRTANIASVPLGR